MISELMADNVSSIVDEDGAESDWIEIFNPDPVPVNMAGWHLTDDPIDPDKWTFPSVVISPGGFLIVWASGKDRTADPAHLHTNFNLRAEGEYLALVSPALVKVTEFSDYPGLDEDQTFGSQYLERHFCHPGAAANLRIPTDDSLGTTWTQPGFTPTGWTNAPINVGFGMLVPGFTVQERKSSVQISGFAAPKPVWPAPMPPTTSSRSVRF